MSRPVEQASLPAEIVEQASLPPSAIPPNKFGSVRTRLTLWNVLTVAIILGILGGVIQYSAQAILLSSVDHDLAAWDRTFAKAPRPERPPPGPPPDGPDMVFIRRHGPPPGDRGHGGNPPFRPLNERDLSESAKAAFWPRLLDPQGQTQFPVAGLKPWDETAFRDALSGNESYTTVTIKNEPVRVFTKPVRRSGRVDMVVQLPHPLADMNKAIEGIRRTLLLLIPVALILAGAGGALVTGRALRPMRQIVETAEQIGAHDLSQRLKIAGNDEFSHLAATFNNVLSRLEGAFTEQKELVRKLEELLEQQRRFTADASHELKSPLTVIKANTSLFGEGTAAKKDLLESIEEIDKAADRMNRLIQDLLFLAKSDAGQMTGYSTDISVSNALAQAEKRKRITSGANVSITETDPSLTIHMDPDDLARVLDNLLDNASRYTPKHGEITLGADSINGAVSIYVKDTGKGVGAEHLPHLGERFYRADASRSRDGGGAGLGLSICKSIAQNYDGSIEIQSELGRGTTVTLLIPNAQPQPTYRPNP